METVNDRSPSPAEPAAKETVSVTPPSQSASFTQPWLDKAGMRWSQVELSTT